MRSFTQGWLGVLAMVIGLMGAGSYADGQETPVEGAVQQAFQDALVKYAADLAKVDGMREQRTLGRAFHDAWHERTIDPWVMEFVKVGNVSTATRRGQSIMINGETHGTKWIEHTSTAPITVRGRFGALTVPVMLERVRANVATKQVIAREKLPDSVIAMLKAARPGESMVVGRYVVDSLRDARWGKPVRLGLGDGEPFKRGDVAGKFELARVMQRSELAAFLAAAKAKNEAAAAEQRRVAALIAEGKRLHPDLAAAESPEQTAWFDALLAYDKQVRSKDVRFSEKRDIAEAFIEAWAGKTLKGYSIELTEVGPVKQRKSGGITITKGKVTNYANEDAVAVVEGRTSLGPVTMELVFEHIKKQTADGKVVESETRHEALRAVIGRAKPGDRIVLDWTLGNLRDYRHGRELRTRTVEFDDDDQGDDDAGTWTNLRLIKSP